MLGKTTEHQLPLEPPGDLLFETWDGDVTTLHEDLIRVLGKHGYDPRLSSFLEETLEAHMDAEGNSSEFISHMWVAYQKDRTRRR